MTALLMLLALPASLCVGGPVPVLDAHSVIPLSAAQRAQSAPVPHPVDSLAEVYRSGSTWDAFFAAVDRRRELWERTWAGAAVPDELADRARAAGGPWRILAITEPGCSDSANTLPYIARLVELAPTLELRIVNSTAGRSWMEAHRSPDGRAATPTLLVLDAEHRIRGCWVEQPAGVQAFWLDVVARGRQAEEVGRKMAWYEEDGGRETLREFVEVLEGAAQGREICPGATDG